MDVVRFHAIFDGAPDKLRRILGDIEGIGIAVPVCRPAVSHDDYLRPGFSPPCMGGASCFARYTVRVLRLPLLFASVAIAGRSRRCGRRLLLLIADVLLAFAKE